jgi:hypothetical protein
MASRARRDRGAERAPSHPLCLFEARWRRAALALDPLGVEPGGKGAPYSTGLYHALAAAGAGRAAVFGYDCADFRLDDAP